MINFRLLLPPPSKLTAAPLNLNLTTPVSPRGGGQVSAISRLASAAAQRSSFWSGSYPVSSRILSGNGAAAAK